MPQESVEAQPSDTSPHLALSDAHVFGVHAVAPHLFGPPPPHISPAAQLPHEIAPPQVSGAMPHSAFCAAHVMGVHAPASSWLDPPASSDVNCTSSNPSTSLHPAPATRMTTAAAAVGRRGACAIHLAIAREAPVPNAGKKWLFMTSASHHSLHCDRDTLSERSVSPSVQDVVTA